MEKWWGQLTLKQRKNALMVGLFVLGLIGVGYGILQYTDNYYTQKAEQASLLYDEMMIQFQKQEGDFVPKAEALVADYPKTPYAQIAHLVLAARGYQQKDLMLAKDHFKTLLKENPGPFVHIARIRLARVLAAEQEYEEALETVTVTDKGGFDMLYQEVMGDIYVQQNERLKANEAYRLAIESAPLGVSVSWLKLKQTDVGGQP